MSTVTIDPRMGVLVIDGKKMFPIGFSNPPPLGKQAPSGKEGLEELADAGGNLIRAGIANWSLNAIDQQIAAEKTSLDAAAAHGLHAWLWLGDVPNLPAAGAPPENPQLLTKIVNAFKSHPALGAWKGIDEPRNPFRGEKWIRPDGLIKAYKRLESLDPNHPVVIIQAPRSLVSELTPCPRPRHQTVVLDGLTESLPRAGIG